MGGVRVKKICHLDRNLDPKPGQENYFFSQGKFNWNWKTIYGNMALGWAMKEPRSCKSKCGGAYFLSLLVFV